MTEPSYREIEVKFLEIDAEALKRKLLSLGAEDRGEGLLAETIFYDASDTWRAENKFARIRNYGSHAVATYKASDEKTVDGTTEYEFSIDPAQTAVVQKFLEAAGLVAARTQEKRRHTFVLDGVTVDIDTWPRIPTYVELEGPSEGHLRALAGKLRFDWSKKVTGTASHVIQDYYHIPVKQLKYFTFERVE